MPTSAKFVGAEARIVAAISVIDLPSRVDATVTGPNRHKAATWGAKASAEQSNPGTKTIACIDILGRAIKKWGAIEVFSRIRFYQVIGNKTLPFITVWFRAGGDRRIPDRLSRFGQRQQRPACRQQPSLGCSKELSRQWPPCGPTQPPNTFFIASKMELIGDSSTSSDLIPSSPLNSS